MARVVSINISARKGVQKAPVPEAELTVNWGIQGDAHAGNWHRQVSFLGQESIDKMTALGIPGLHSGDFAENITTEGIILYDLPVGTYFRIGPVLFKVTQIGKECHQHCAIYKIVKDCVMPREGIFAVVLEGGIIRPGMDLEIIPAPASSAVPAIRNLKDSSE